MESKKIGRITRASFGHGGYQDAQIGLSLTFESKGWGVGHFDGMWSGKRTDGTRWSEEDRLRLLGETTMRLSTLLAEAEAHDVAGLVGKPVEVTFNGNTLESFRILTEVL